MDATGDGGALIVSGDDTSVTFVSDSDFTNNTVTNGNGGAVVMTGGLLLLSNVAFTGNQALSVNKGGNGGAIYMYGGRVVNTDTPATPARITTFEDNAADYSGGAINCNAAGGILYLTYAKFENNHVNGTTTGTVTANGGAIASACLMAVSFIQFVNNTANSTDSFTAIGKGGAIFIDGGTQPTSPLDNGLPSLPASQDPILSLAQEIELSGMNFNGVQFNNPMIRDSYIYNNSSTHDGGGIYTDGPLYLVRSSVSLNWSGTGQGMPDGRGSGVFISASAGKFPVMIANTTIYGNQAAANTGGQAAAIWVASTAKASLVNDTIASSGTTPQSVLYLEQGPGMMSGDSPVDVLNSMISSTSPNVSTCGGDTTRIDNVTSWMPSALIVAPSRQFSPASTCHFVGIEQKSPYLDSWQLVGSDPTVPQAMQTYRFLGAAGYLPPSLPFQGNSDICNNRPIMGLDQLAAARLNNYCVLGAVQGAGAPLPPPPPAPHRIN
jgi:hypothetical protein